MNEQDRDRQPRQKDEAPPAPADEPRKPPRQPLAERLREKMEKIRKDDRNVYPLY
jgi:hypothetical protein